MNENTEILLRELAEKLGTTSEYLWQNLLNQAPISGSFHIIWAILLLFLAVFVGNNIKRKMPEWKREYDNVDINSIVALHIIGMSFFGAFFLIVLYNSVTAFMNPGFWAMKEILYLLK
jgi:hypothetical protein